MDQLASKPFSSTGPYGHRSRMRGRLLGDETALADYEILEMLLFLGIPRRDTKPLAKGLINRFGSLGAAIGAEPAALDAAGLPPRAVEALGAVVEAAGILAQPDAIRRKVVGDLAALEAYLDLPGRAAEPPGWSALLLNNRNQVLAEPAWEPEAAGGLVRELMRHALDGHATAAILLRNAGAAAPAITAADRALHAEVRRAGAPLGVVVHDLVVMGRGDWLSLRQLGH